MTYGDDIFGLLFTPQKAEVDRYVAAQISAATTPLQAQIATLNAQTITLSRLLEVANARIKELETPKDDLLAFRRTLVPGTYMANSNRHAGLIEQDRSKYTVKTGTQRINAGDKFYRVWFKDGVDIRGKAEFQECIFNAPDASDGACVRGTIANGLFGSLFEHCLIDGEDTSPTRNAIWLSNATVRFSEITRCVDLGSFITQSTGPTLSEGNWYHNTSYFEGPQTGQSDQKTHNDGIQFHRGKNFVSRGDYFEDIDMQGMMIKQEVDSTALNRIENVIIDRPYFGKGIKGAAINISVARGNAFETLQILNPKFMKSTDGGARWTILRNPDTFKGKIVNPTYFDGTPAPVMRGA